MKRKPTIDDRLTADDRLAILTTVRTLVANGKSQNCACALAGVKVPTYKRWLALYEQGGIEALEPGHPTGRPPEYVFTDEEATALKALLVRTNLGKGKGSQTVAARMFTQNPACSDKAAEVILRDRTSKHSLPPSVRKAMKVTPGVIDFHRGERGFKHNISASVGNLRIDCGGRRLRGGDQQSWDDASINMIVWVPWGIGGDRCSEKFGVKAERFQLLAGPDDGAGFCPGFSYIIRAQGTYRAQDVTGAMARTWMGDVKPRRAILEKGVWQSLKAARFYRLTGVDVRHVHTSNDKLVENFWGRLWTPLSTHDGQIGRFRGEMERENNLLTRCQSGSLDPREVFPSLETVLNAIEAGINYLNTEKVHSKKYGTWIPQERYYNDLADQNLQPLALDNAWLLAPEQHTWTVRRNGTCGGMVPCPLGASIPYFFACDRLWEYIGAKVTVFFDPYMNPMRPAIVLEEPFRGEPAGTILSTNALSLSDGPHISRLEESYAISNGDTRGFEAALKYKQAYFRAVRTEHRDLGLNGRRKKHITQIDNGIDQRQVIEISSPAAPAQAPAPQAAPSRITRRSAARPSRASGELPAPSRINLAEPDAEKNALVDRARRRMDEVRARGADALI